MSCPLRQEEADDYLSLRNAGKQETRASNKNGARGTRNIEGSEPDWRNEGGASKAGGERVSSKKF